MGPTVLLGLMFAVVPERDGAQPDFQSDEVPLISTSTNPEVFDVAVEPKPTKRRVVGYLRADSKPVLRALTNAPSYVRCPLELADALVRAGIMYRPDGSLKSFDREHLPRALSCSEFVYWMYSACGFNLGTKHDRTKDMAYRKADYEGRFARLAPDQPVEVGDLLVYHYPRPDLPIRPAGHVVMVVSADENIVVGSHGNVSTPKGKPTGVGYRRVVDWQRWTDSRRLRVILRPKKDD